MALNVSPVWVKSAGLNGALSLPVCHNQQTISEPNRTSHGPKADIAMPPLRNARLRECLIEKPFRVRRANWL